MGSVHLILKGFEKEGIVISENVGNSLTYKINFDSRIADQIIGRIRSEESDGFLKKTKIVCTIGPVTKDITKIREMIKNGMNVARINSSHENEESLKTTIELIRRAEPSIPILVDIPGIKIRLDVLDKEVTFEKGEILKFSSNPESKVITVDHKDLHLKLNSGINFSMDDGTVGFKVKEVVGDIIHCEALNEGVIKSRKGMNIPGLDLGKEYLTKEDEKLIKSCIKNNVNFVGVSFIKSANQVEMINEVLSGTMTKLISKVETKEAMEDYHKIIEKSYGIMVDRGDLGAEIGLEKIPRLQKKIIDECNYQGKPIIIATQMMESMRFSPYPTKSEITDVANAVLDGASAVMLSAETAAGKYPIEVVSTMTSIILDIENELTHQTFDDETKYSDSTNLMGGAISNICDKMHVDKIICITSGGFSARMLARHKLSTQVIAVTDKEEVHSIMNLMWGVRPLLINTKIDNSGSVEQKKEVINLCLEKGLITEDDTILLTGAIFPNHRKITNMIELHKVGEFLGYFREANKND